MFAGTDTLCAANSSDYTDFLVNHVDSCFLFDVVWGGGPRVVISTVFFHAGVRGSCTFSTRFEKKKMFLLHPLVKLVKVYRV